MALAARPGRSGMRAVRRAVLGLSILAGSWGAMVLTNGAVSAHADTAARIAWRPCGHQLQCARVRVPLNWAQPGAGTISLAVIRHLTSRPRQRIGSLFFNPGGPGVSGVDTLRSAGAGLDTFGLGRFDVISWDPRGTGASSHVRCFATERQQTRFWGGASVPITRAQELRYQPKTVAFAQRCGALTRTLLAHVSTEDTARDLDYLRRLLGEPRLSYLGWSYGSFLGETYANLFPRRVRAMVLDGIIDPVPYTQGREASLANTMAPIDGVFTKFESLCQSAGPARCALAGHGPVSARVNRLLARLRHASIPAPQATPPVRLTYADALTAIFAQLRDPAVWPQFAAQLNAAANGDGSALEVPARAFKTPAGRAALVPSVAIGCADSPARERPRAWPRVINRLTGVSRLLGPVLGWWLWAPCASWPARSAERYTGPWNAPTAKPILVIGTRFDPNTSYANARRVARRLGNAVLLTHDGYGHVSVSDPSACVDATIGRYLTRLVAPRGGAVCRSDRQPFDPAFGEPVAGVGF